MLETKAMFSPLSLIFLPYDFREILPVSSIDHLHRFASSHSHHGGRYSCVSTAAAPQDDQQTVIPHGDITSTAIPGGTHL